MNIIFAQALSAAAHRGTASLRAPGWSAAARK